MSQAGYGPAMNSTISLGTLNTLRLEVGIYTIPISRRRN